MRIIIDNQSCRPDHVALSYAQRVMKEGKVSSSNGWVYKRKMFEGVLVECSKNKGSDRIVVKDMF